jgi:hypothetical protein
MIKPKFIEYCLTRLTLNKINKKNMYLYGELKKLRHYVDMGSEEELILSKALKLSEDINREARKMRLE